MAMSTFSPSNSSVHDWLSFDGDTLPALPACRYNDTDVSCRQVCHNSSSLFSKQSNNLVTCGLWTNLVLSYSDSVSFGVNGTLGPVTDNSSQGLLPAFESLDLNASDFRNASLYADTISNCFEFIYINAKAYSFDDNGNVPAACTRGDLFPIGSYNESLTGFHYNNSLKDCLQAICSPLTLDPDLAGIGVFSSFIAQSAIALIALGALLAFDLWAPLARQAEKAPEKAHANSLVIALVQFHKAQCYFASVIQITALSLFQNSRKGFISHENSESEVTAGTYQDFFDTSVLIVLATSGIIPVSLTLALITRYGRQSWYLLILSWITIVLASITLITCYHWTHKYGNDIGTYDNNLQYGWDYDNNYGAENSCDLSDYFLGDVVTPLCGNNKLYDNSLSSKIIASWWAWLVWTNCIIWTIFCLGKKCYNTERFFNCRNKMTALLGKASWAIVIVKEGRARRTWSLIFLISWLLCFASQFYLFSEFFERRVISYKWSFGQIIALFVWVPSIVEYIYIEINGIQKASAYRYPAGLMVVRHFTQSTFSLAKVASPEVRGDPRMASQTHYALLDESRDA